MPIKAIIASLPLAISVFTFFLPSSLRAKRHAPSACNAAHVDAHVVAAADRVAVDVRAHVSSPGEDADAHAAEEGDAGSVKALAQDGLIQGLCARKSRRV